MAQTSCNGVNNILVYNSGNDSLGTTVGVKYFLYMCKYIKTAKNTASGSVSTYVKNNCTIRRYCKALWENHPACGMCPLVCGRVMQLCGCGSRCRVCKVERMPCCVWTSWRRSTTSYSCSSMISRQRCCAVRSCCSLHSCRVYGGKWQVSFCFLLLGLNYLFLCRSVWQTVVFMVSLCRGQIWLI